MHTFSAPVNHFYYFLTLFAGPAWFSSVILERGALAGKAGKPTALRSYLSHLTNLPEIREAPKFSQPQWKRDVFLTDFTELLALFGPSLRHPWFLNEKYSLLGK